MCHAGRVRLSPAETKEMKRLYGTLVPVYASVVLVLVAAMTVSSGLRPDRSLLANNTVPAIASADRVKAAD